MKLECFIFGHDYHEEDFYCIHCEEEFPTGERTIPDYFWLFKTYIKMFFVKLWWKIKYFFVKDDLPF